MVMIWDRICVNSKHQHEIIINIESNEQAEMKGIRM
jgi:hypothetical protein